MNNSEFLEKLRTLVVDYDRDHGRWVESEFEGLSFYQDVLYRLGIEDDSENLEQKYPKVYGDKDYD
jgi:hypothetical protein